MATSVARWNLRVTSISCGLIPDQERLSITAFADGVAGGLVVQVLDRDLQVIGDSAATIAVAGAREPDWASATAEITLPVETGELHYLRVQAKDPMSVGRYALSVVNFDGGWWLPVADSPRDKTFTRRFQERTRRTSRWRRVLFR